MSYLATARRILSEQGLERESGPPVYVTRAIATSPNGVSVIEHSPCSGDGAVFWEKVVPLGENGVMELRGPQTCDPFFVAGWLAQIAPKEVEAFRRSWNL